MPRQLALFIYVLFIIYLFWIDRNKFQGVSRAIWIPLTWFFFGMSRNFSLWIKVDMPDIDISEYADIISEGSPYDRAIYSILILAGMMILWKRKINWYSWFVRNRWIWLYFIFGALSISWSDYPYVSFKRLIKASSTIIMALVIVSEERPYIAIGVILKRIAFILLPLSILFIKYYPKLGRSYHMGKALYTGVCTSKNSLGTLCLISGIYFSWNLCFGRKIANETSQQLHYSIYLIILPMLAWLFYMVNSATSLVCIVVTVSLFVIARQPIFFREQVKIIFFTITCIVMFVITDLFFNIKDTIFALLGRSPDLTTRIPMWQDILSMVRNPLIGFGYESFWLGERLDYLTSKWGFLKQSHNGYLEMYVNMGFIGVCFIIAWVASGLKSVKSHMIADYPIAILRFCFILIVVIYNYTEATFYGSNVMWCLFFLGIMNLPERIKQEKQPI